ncbi:purine or other phosphorylase family 1 [Gloeothece verrucosa]|uniref:Purine or other phosphorylase family 1 n=1 Tax=Gloeothece verrucosa (strain PCC 7822) TaxID=497965 RepID=E0UEJ8_GLOV7|nr:purine or other phosphorylase family 1 [Gloeothece verrucosa]ADN16566.1 purine or other phosphorylase family 1 [Gloeothece verrucosa PCC 7822]
MIDSTPSKLDLNPVTNSIDAILVPQGAEYQAVCRGLKGKSELKPKVISIAMGCQSSGASLEQWIQSTEFLNKPPKNLLLMGLCGGLSPNARVGEIVIYSGCGYAEGAAQLLWQDCQSDLVKFLQNQLKDQAKLVKGLTSDRLITLAKEKQALYQQYQMDVVDMEGFTALKVFNEVGIKTAMIRVISDDCQQNLPNITSAISADGSLKPIPLALSMIQQPYAAIQLIKSSLKGLRVLEELSSQLIFTL